MFDLKLAVRSNILALKPYRCARDDYSCGVLLDANENAYGSAALNSGVKGLERYPDPRQNDIKQLICNYRKTSTPENLFLGVGSDECIDLAIRVFCKPGVDRILITPPTYGIYSVSAQVNDVSLVKIPLLVGNSNFQLDVPGIISAIKADPTIKIVFLCSPGNPTGTLLKHGDIKEILECSLYKGVVFVDEAYIDFIESESISAWASSQYPNLIVSQTLSKAFGLAGARLGYTISSREIAQIFNNTKAPYNISSPSSKIAKDALSPLGISQMRENVCKLLSQRTRLLVEFKKIVFLGSPLGLNDANFILIPVVHLGLPSNKLAHDIYFALAETCGVVVRFRGMEYGCEGTLRITVGTEEDNTFLLEQLKSRVINDLVTLMT